MTAKTKRAPRKRAGLNPNDFWIIDGDVTYRRDLPAGVEHPDPDRPECVPVDEKILRKCKTTDTYPAFPDGIPPEAVLTWTERGFSLRETVRVREVVPYVDGVHKRTKVPIIKKRTEAIGALQSIFYRRVLRKRRPGSADGDELKPGPMLPAPMWRHWAKGRGIPVGREGEHADDIRIPGLRRVRVIVEEKGREVMKDLRRKRK